MPNTVSAPIAAFSSAMPPGRTARVQGRRVGGARDLDADRTYDVEDLDVHDGQAGDVEDGVLYSNEARLDDLVGAGAICERGRVRTSSRRWTRAQRGWVRRARSRVPTPRG